MNQREDRGHNGGDALNAGQSVLLAERVGDSCRLQQRGVDLLLEDHHLSLELCQHARGWVGQVSFGLRHQQIRGCVKAKRGRRKDWRIRRHQQRGG